MSAPKVRLLSDDDLALVEVFGVDVKKWTGLARWARRIYTAVQTEWGNAGYSEHERCPEPCGLCDIQALLAEIEEPTP